MKREGRLKRRLRTLRTLSEAVTATKSLAAHHYSEARAALAPAEAYREALDRVVRQTGIWIDSRESPVGMLLVAADLALDGDYSARLTEAALKTGGEGPLYCVGRRPRGRLTRSGRPIHRHYSMPLSLDGLPTFLLQLAQDLLDDHAAGHLGSLVVVSARFLGVGRFEPDVTQVIPPPVLSRHDVESAERKAARLEPFHPSPYVSATHLRAVALREWLYTVLYGLMLDALAAEHGARLVATDAAQRWIDDSIAAVGRELANTRREGATQEVLEIASGWKFVGKARR